MNTNVVYLTTRCNLNCEYCYENDSRESLVKQKDCTEEQFDIFLTEILKAGTRTDSCTCIVLFGGEPFLNYRVLRYALLKLANEYPNQFAVDLTTNGTLLTGDLYEDFKNLYFEIRNRVHLTPKISYDGIGHIRRRYINGTSSKEIVESVLENFVKDNIRFNISYTLHEVNARNNLWMKDVLYLCNKYKDHLEKFLISPVYSEIISILSTIFKKKLAMEESKILLRAMGRELYKHTKIPICELSCVDCRLCNFSQRNLYFTPGQELRVLPKSFNKVFDHWENKDAK